MTIFDIWPQTSVGPIRLGISLDEFLAKFGPPKLIRDNRYEYLPGFFVDVDQNNHVEFIELGASSEFIAHFKGFDVHRTSAKEILKLFESEDGFDRQEPDLGQSYIFKKIQISLWRNVMPENENDEDGRFFDAVGIAVPQYF